MNFHYKEFDFVKINKIHSNEFFSVLKSQNTIADISNKKFVKERPAIIVKIIGSIFLVIPLTTKTIKDQRAHNLLRTQFIDKNFSTDGKNSYLMFDSLLRIEKSQIIGLYKKCKKCVIISNSTKKWLKREAANKYSTLFL